MHLRQITAYKFETINNYDAFEVEVIKWGSKTLDFKQDIKTVKCYSINKKEKNKTFGLIITTLLEKLDSMIKQLEVIEQSEQNFVDQQPYLASEQAVEFTGYFHNSGWGYKCSIHSKCGRSRTQRSQYADRLYCVQGRCNETYYTQRHNQSEDFSLFQFFRKNLIGIVHIRISSVIPRVTWLTNFFSSN